MKHIQLLFPAFCMLLISCGDIPTCKNTNTVFDNNLPNSEAYKAELAKQIQLRNSKEIFYWIDKNTVENGKDYLLVYIQSGDLCAKMHMQVNERGDLAHVIEVNAGGYHHAGLDGLQYDIVQDSTGTNFIYKSIEDIVD